MTPIDPLPLLAPLERAAGAIGRLARAAAASPVLAAWLHRSRAEAAVALVAAQGRGADVHRLRAALAQAPLRPSRDWGATRLALEVLHALLAPEGIAGDNRPPAGPDLALGRMAAARAANRAGAGGSVLLACGLGVLDHLEAGGDRTDAGLAVPRFLAAHGLTPQPLPCLNGAGAMRRAAPGGDWPAAFLDDIARQAVQGEDELVALLHRWRGWRRAVGERRRDARIRRAIDLVAAEGVVGPARLAAGLRCATSAATALLEELQRLGIVVEITRRRTHRLFVAEDLGPMLAVVEGAAAPGAAARPMPPAALEPDAWLEPAEAVDDALRNLERVMQRRDRGLRIGDQPVDDPP